MLRGSFFSRPYSEGELGGLAAGCLGVLSSQGPTQVSSGGRGGWQGGAGRGGGVLRGLTFQGPAYSAP